MGLGDFFAGGKKPDIYSTGKIANKSFGSTVNQIGPGFRTEFGVDDEGKRFQRFLETGDQAALTEARGSLARGLSPVAETLTSQIATGYGDPGTRGDIERATFDRALALLGPELDRRERTTRNNLVNTGNPIGSERAGYELDLLDRRRNNQMSDLALGSVLAGLDAQGREVFNRGAAIDNSGRQLGQIGNIFSIMQADRPEFFAPGQLLSPELVLNRSLGKAGIQASRNASKSNLLGGAISGASRVGAALAP